MSAQDSTELDLLGLFAAIDRGDIRAAVGYMHEDVVLWFGNLDPVHGRDAIESLNVEFTSQLRGVRHELHDVWTPAGEGDVRIVRMTVHYTRLDGDVVSLPCCNVYRLRDGAIVEYRVYMDAGPVFT